MSQPPIKAKIDVSKIKKEHLFRGQKGVYLDVSIWPNKDGAIGQYGDTHYIVQDLGKAARDAGERGSIIGNLKMPPSVHTAPKKAIPADKPKAISPDEAVDQESDDVPF